MGDEVIALGCDKFVGGGVSVVAVIVIVDPVVVGEEIVIRNIINNATTFIQWCHFSDGG